MSLLLDLYVDTARQLAGKGPDDLVAQAPAARA
jgi:hypothetical protein